MPPSSAECSRLNPRSWPGFGAGTRPDSITSSRARGTSTSSSIGGERTAQARAAAGARGRSRPRPGAWVQQCWRRGTRRLPRSRPSRPRGEPWHALWTWGVTRGLRPLRGRHVARAQEARSRCASRSSPPSSCRRSRSPAPLLLSKDVYLYWSEARIAIVHHANPYRATPAAYPTDPALQLRLRDLARRRPRRTVRPGRRSARFRQPRPARRPTAPSSATGCSRLLGVLAAALLIARRTRNAAAVALLGWSPLVALHFAGGGHNDAWMIALLVLGVAAPRPQRAERPGRSPRRSSSFPPILLPLELAARRLRAPAAGGSGSSEHARRGRRRDRCLRAALGDRASRRGAPDARRSAASTGSRSSASAIATPSSPAASHSPRSISRCCGRPGAPGGHASRSLQRRCA